jgi:hypothetical protein
VNRLYDEPVHVVHNIYCTYVFGAGRHGMRSMENLGAYNPSNEESPTIDGMPSPNRVVLLLQFYMVGLTKP